MSPSIRPVPAISPSQLAGGFGACGGTTSATALPNRVTSTGFPVLRTRARTRKQVEAFESVREDLGNSYTVTYYPAPNPNEGFRRITVQIPSDAAKKYRIRARPGYRPRAAF